MRILLTGASGFVGRHLARAAVGGGDQVVGTYLGPAPTVPGVELVEVNVLDRVALARLVAVARPQAVVHLAGLSHVGESWHRMPDYFQVNVVGTETLLAVVGGVPILFASSAEIYGAVPEAEQPLVEDRMPAPRSPYALSKAAAERLVLGHGGVVVRFFNLVGSGQGPTFALPGFAAQLAANAGGRAEPVLAVGNLSARRDFVHVEDAVEALLLLLAQGAAGTIYNLASGAALSIAEALEKLVAASGLAVTVAEDPARLRPVDVPLLRGDASRLRALGWQPHRAIDQALAEVWEAAKAEVEASRCAS